MRTILCLAVLILATSCGAHVTLAPGGGSYSAPTYYNDAGYGVSAPRGSAAIPADSPEVRLPFAVDTRAPQTVYAGEAFPVAFDVSADDAPQILWRSRLPSLAMQVRQAGELGYDGKLTIGPWLLAAAPLDWTPLNRAVDEPLTTVAVSVSIPVPGTYVLELQSADKREHGGRPARFVQNGVEFLRGEVALTTKRVTLVVLPARNTVQPRSYNEPAWAYSTSSGAYTWNRTPFFPPTVIR